MFEELKFNPDIPFHYIISVERNSNVFGDDAGSLRLRFQPIFFTNDDIVKMRDVVARTRDRVFKTTLNEALEIYGITELFHSLSMVMMLTRMSNCTLHHFSMKHKIKNDKEYEWFNDFLKDCKPNTSSMEFLKDAKI